MTSTETETGPRSLGYNTEGDVLVNVTNDGTDVNQLWEEVNRVLDSWNAERSSVGSLLSRLTINAAEAIPQAIADESFELASEFGEPQSQRAPGNAVLLGNTFNDYDRAGRYTWKFLRDATAEQVRAVTNYVLAADNKLCNGLILRRLFDPAPQVNEYGHTCYGLYSGDGMVPPSYLGKVFDGNHNHYIVSEGDTIDPGDLDLSIRHIEEHGYAEPPARLLAFMNPVEADEVAAFKAGEESNGVVAKHSFIPSAGAPPWILSEGGTIQGEIAPKEFGGLKIDGSYGPCWVVRSNYVPEHYVAVVATAGPDNPTNVVSVRQHPNKAYQGLRIIKGKVPEYPLQDSFWARGIGVGIRHRGAGVCTMIADGGDYVAPEITI